MTFLGSERTGKGFQVRRFSTQIDATAALLPNAAAIAEMRALRDPLGDMVALTDKGHNALTDASIKALTA